MVWFWILFNVQGEVQVDKFIFDGVNEKDIDKIVDIYNSNVSFLSNHLGVSSISRDFILNELDEMKKIGFHSLVIKNYKGEVVGLCDYKLGDDVYLSLLMIDRRLKGNGLGKSIYQQLEDRFRKEKAKRVRIDVVYNYNENVLGFWNKLGFVPSEKIELEWNGFKSKAVKMYKNIR